VEPVSPKVSVTNDGLGWGVGIGLAVAVGLALFAMKRVPVASQRSEVAKPPQHVVRPMLDMEEHIEDLDVNHDK